MIILMAIVLMNIVLMNTSNHPEAFRYLQVKELIGYLSRIIWGWGNYQGAEGLLLPLPSLFPAQNP